MRTGCVVRHDGEHVCGIVIRSYNGLVDVMTKDYSIYTFKENSVVKTGKYFDMSLVWEMVRDENRID